MDLNELLEQTLPALGVTLVDLEMSPKGRTIRVFIDTLESSSTGITVDDCERVSHHLSHLFTVENVDYDRLEVSSPGLDRPLKKIADFARFAGSYANIKLNEKLGETRKMKALLRGVEGDCVLVTHENTELKIEFSRIDRARLIPDILWRKAK
ncbi:MAG: ribosome maturation factor RimP [Burkholderiales bacterium]|nr:ribosome maturation factor RimP [Burkholderiales bacterium]